MRWACAEEEIRERTYPDSITGARKETVVYETTECDSFAQEQAVQGDTSTVPAAYEYRFTPWSVKTNLLYDVLLAPSLEIEYRISKRWSVGLEGALASWSNANRHRYYHLAFISPEARYWFQAPERRKGHYVGLFAGGRLVRFAERRTRLQRRGNVCWSKLRLSVSGRQLFLVRGWHGHRISEYDLR